MRTSTFLLRRGKRFLPQQPKDVIEEESSCDLVEGFFFFLIVVGIISTKIK